MMRRLVLALVVILGLGLGVTSAAPSDAAPNCQIPAGPYRVNGYTGCASAKWTKSGSGGYYSGYIHDETYSWGALVVEYRTPSGVWRWLGSDVWDGNNWSNVTRLHKWQSGPCRPTRMRDSYATLAMNACS